MATLPMPPRSTPSPPAGHALEAGSGSPGLLRTSPLVYAASSLAVLGVFGVWPAALMLWSLWTTDPLKSIGGVVPLVSFLLILRVWRASGWQSQGSWWGLVLLAFTVAVVQLRAHAVLELVFSASWSTTLPPLSVAAFAYASALVLLVGGGTLWRAAAFPVLLMLLVNPVPHAFSRLVDLPLQHASAAVARSLAQALGQRLTPDQLYLMFTPDFGMFIAPGCDGIRGAVTLGLIALVAGYLYRFSAWVRFLSVGAAVLLGYVFNLLRLCVLVLYYVLALHWKFLQPHAEMGDYCIGATLFFGAALLFFAAVRRLSPGQEQRIPPPELPASGMRAGWQADSVPWRIALLACVLLLGAAPLAHSHWRPPAHSLSSAPGMPETVGRFHLRKTWPETLSSGTTIFTWATYQVSDQSPEIEVGLSPNLGAHDALLCHVARGDDPLWQGPLLMKTATAEVEFSGALYSQGSVRYLEASTLCTVDGCGQSFRAGPKHLGLVWSPVSATAVLRGAQPVPVLLRVELRNASIPTEEALEILTRDLREFSAYASFDAFTYRYLRP